jgi:hypothetical protein
MDRALEKRLWKRAVELGNSGRGDVLQELLSFTRESSAQVRRLAVSAIGKLAGLADATSAVAGLQPLLRDPHPQVRQYTIKALSAYGAASSGTLCDLNDIESNLTEKEYNRRAAAKAIAVIKEAMRIAEKRAEHRCQRCSTRVDADEYARSQRAFQRVFCDNCFDEVYLERRNFDTKVELNKNIKTKNGTFVQSDGERMIADFLNRHGITFRYDERIRIIDGYAVRPDFYLPEFDLYIEYWGMDTIDYKIGMLKKMKLYQQEGKSLISIYREDKPHIEQVLSHKLSRYMRIQQPGIEEKKTPH